PPAERPRPAAADPARHTSGDFAARPAPVELDLTDHPAYELPVPEPVDCSLPRVDAGSADSWVVFNDALSFCLTRLWRPRLEELGLRSVEPEFRVSRAAPEADGPLDESTLLAYYEGEPMAVTLVLPNVVRHARDLPADWEQSVWVSLLAHEYGHHVQQLAGILAAGSSQEREAPTDKERLQTRRRMELQAECLAGVAMQGLDGIGGTETGLVDEYLAYNLRTRTHGTGSNRSDWFHAGANHDSLGACNTYGAPPAQVE
ncbi:neutral zinc metallopeptidase, partial [Streptomonospora algeriensis]